MTRLQLCMNQMPLETATLLDYETGQLDLTFQSILIIFCTFAIKVNIVHVSNLAASLIFAPPHASKAQSVMDLTIYSPRASASTATRFAPAFLNIREHSETVDMVVSTSSISKTDLPSK